MLIKIAFSPSERLREIVLRLNTSSQPNWISDLARGSPSTVRILDCKPGRDGAVQQLVELNTPEAKLDEAIEAIRRNPQVIDVYMAKTRTGKSMGRVLSRGAVACKSVMESNLFCRSCLFSSKSSPDGAVEWTLAFSDGRSLSSFLKRLESERISVEIRRLSKMVETKGLTPRQMQVIQRALDRGYFEYPRKTDLSTLAGELKVSKSTVGEILRRAEKKALTSMYGSGAERLSSVPS